MGYMLAVLHGCHSRYSPLTGRVGDGLAMSFFAMKTDNNDHQRASEVEMYNNTQDLYGFYIYIYICIYTIQTRED